MLNYFNKILRYTFYLLFIPFWYLQLLIPRNKRIWVFGAWYGKQFSDNNRFLFEYACKQKDGIKPIWLTKDVNVCNQVNKLGYSCYMANSLRGVFYSLRASIIIESSGSSDVNNYLVNGAKTILTWHGAPMKKIKIFDDSKKIKKLRFLFPFANGINKRIDYIVSTSLIFDTIMSDAGNVPIENVIKSGYPRNEVFYNSTLDKLSSRLNKDFQNPLKILFLPTFRDYNPGMDLFYDYKFNDLKINTFLSSMNAVLITKKHFVDNQISDEKYSFDRIIHLNSKDGGDVNLLLSNCDILITDYSGAYFDFLIKEKPVVFSAFDLDVYKRERGINFEYKDITAGPIVRNWDEIICEIKEICVQDKFISKRSEMNLKFNSYNSSDSSRKLYESLKQIIHYV